MGPGKYEAEISVISCSDSSHYLPPHPYAYMGERLHTLRCSAAIPCSSVVVESLPTYLMVARRDGRERPAGRPRVDR
jgi:hypothetical protein